MRRVLATIAALALVLAPGAGAAEPQTSLPDIEDEVMCTICGTLLELADNPQAERERAFIRELIARGMTKDQIKDALVAEYGQAVLATPEDSGFDATAYVIPILAAVIGAVGLGTLALRWRRRDGPDDPGPMTRPSGSDAERLETDLARYDL